MTAPSEAALRDIYPGTRGQIYFDSAAIGLVSQPVVEAVSAIVQDHCRLGIAANEAWRTEIAKTRVLVARLIGGAADRVAFSQNTSTAIALVINGLDWTEGDNVVLSEGEFPSNSYPWLALRRKGVEVRRVRMQNGRSAEKALVGAVDSRTRALAVSSVQYSSGYRYDLQFLGAECSRRNTLLVVDGTQSVGALNMRADEWGIDALCVSAHKWLNGPLGIGFAHFSEKAMNVLHPSVVGWMSVKEPFSFTYEPDLADDGRRFESGTEIVPGIAGLAATSSLVLEIGTEEVERIVLKRARSLEEICLQRGMSSFRSSYDEAHHSGILMVSCSDDATLHRNLIAANVRCSLRAYGVRLSPHYFNTSADIEQFEGVLSSLTLAA
ncbi:aminotransferase class V-fold PLP-dependent enzyme [Paenarthrobacter sp. YJN-5]|uniref:aminotransferase class V-fold PLP-dependent enzyme n=1 Tax=Paenarthrobacter sp. YJN-5 TaxID=2735316 RepID=UPI00187788C5|nr:aminotransferase class V-fold PLP-dependent enzyme [Paenarthrobacter sp. YJN-5]QOT19834.1 aminotransferase class V-fold PLP-dependent enzyme [Paenarthrobacter sp. YJN-5]